MKPERDQVPLRLCGDYLHFFSSNPLFFAYDAVALAQLEFRTEVGYLKDFYTSAAKAVVDALGLPSNDVVRMLLQQRKPPDPPSLMLTIAEMLEVMQLSRLRQATLALYREHDGYLLGSPFLAEPAFQDKPYQPSLQQVAAWWTVSRHQMPRGVQLIDEAICAMVGWDTATGVPFKRLLRDFGYPDPAPVYNQSTKSW
jgi:hypothetical protein